MKKITIIVSLYLCTLPLMPLCASQESDQELSESLSHKLGSWREVKRYHELSSRNNEPSMIYSLCLSDDKKMLLSLADTVKIRKANNEGVWRSEDCGEIETHPGYSRAIALSPDKKMMIVANFADILVCVLDSQGNWTRQELVLRGERDNNGRSAQIFSLALSADKRMIVSGHTNGSVCVWTANEHGAWGVHPHAALKCVGCASALALSEDKKMIVSGAYASVFGWNAGDDGEWPLGSFSLSRSLRGRPLFRGASSVALSADKRTIVVGSMEQAVCVYKADSRNEWSNVPAAQLQEERDGRYGGSIKMPVVLSADSKMIVHGTPSFTSRMETVDERGIRTPAQGNFDDMRQLVCIKTVDSNGVWRQESHNDLPKGTSEVTAIALSKDKRTLALGDRDGDIRILEYTKPSQKVVARVKQAAQLFLRGKHGKQQSASCSIMHDK